MKPVKIIDSISEGIPDDLLIVSTGFEERSTAVSRAFHPSYRARCAFIAHFMSRTTRKGEMTRKNSTGELFFRLRSIDVQGSPRLVPLHPHDVQAFWEEIYFELDRRKIDIANSKISIDVSCLPRLQLMFTVRELSRERSVDCRIFYTEPMYYSTERGRGKNLVNGKYKTLTIPFDSKGALTQKILKPQDINKRICIVGLGHEGERVLNTWRSLEPNKTFIIMAESKFRRRNLQATSRNRFFVRQVGIKNPAFSKIEHKMEDISYLYSELDRCVSVDADNSEFFIIPFGPKPQVSTIAEWACAQSDKIFNIGYFLPEMYSGDYSIGAHQIFEYKLGSNRFNTLPLDSNT